MGNRVTRRLVVVAALMLALTGSSLAVAATDHDGAPGPASACPPPSQALAGVYHPGRLRVIDPCASASGTVVRIKHEVDGDVHLLINLDPASSRLLDQGNLANAGGNLVSELMPRDAGHFTAPQVGDHVHLIGAWTHDSWHNWDEIHPVWALSANGGPWQVSGPASGGSPPAASPYAAASACRTPSGSHCRGY